jgi:signal transduction histidine kinase
MGTASLRAVSDPGLGPLGVGYQGVPPPGWAAAAGGGGGRSADGEHAGERPARGPSRVLRTAVSAWADERTWRELGYLVVAAPLAVAAFGTLAAAMFASGLLAVTLVGIPLLALTLTAARHYGAAERALAGGILGERIAPPPPLRPRRPGFLGRLRAMLTDRAGWKAVAHIVVAMPLRIGGLYGVVLGAAVSAILATYPVIWSLFEPTQTDPDGVVHESYIQFGDAYMDTWPEALALGAVGLAGLMIVPWLLRLVVLPDRFLTRALLGPGALAERVRDLEETRAHAVDDSAATLRRIERDLHDGTQARLVALAMQLDMAREELASSPDSPGATQARTLLDTAHRNATEAIGELREVTRRIHPPALDRGLDTALATLAARSAVPVAVRVHLPVRPTAAVETIAYFCVAELLTNVAKHSGATRAAVDVTVPGPGTGAVLRLRVSDDGRGGAVAVPGGGLAGLGERARTIDGHMSLSSPAGGPTVVTIDLPLRS